MKKAPKILFWDIESSPIFGTSWELYDARILEVIKDPEILCYAYKYQGDDTVYSKRQKRFDKLKPSDEAVIRHAHRILSKVDLLIAHNGDQFDFKKLNNRILYYGLPPLPPIASVDTKKAAKLYFNFNSNSLQELARYLGIGCKVEHEGYGLWKKCMNNDQDAWKRMVKYNKGDVTLLEKVYNRMKPHILNHPNVENVANKDQGLRCNKCSDSVLVKWGFRPSAAGLRRRWLCKSCGGYVLSALSKEAK